MKNQTVVITIPGGACDGLRAKVLRQSAATSEIVVELIEGRGSEHGWKKGDKVQVKKWELRHLNGSKLP